MDASADSMAERVYEQVKAMAVGYAFKPGARLNEGEVAQHLGVSRTPLREALNRLTSEGFLRLEPGKGYFCRELNAQEVLDLYELRSAVEVAGIWLAAGRAPAGEIDALLAFLDATGPDPGTRTPVELVALDEMFHERLLAMSGNAEMGRVLRNVNARIRFVRWIDMGREDRVASQGEHRAMLLALKAGDAAGCAALLERHIAGRMDQITAAIKEGYARIYMGG